MTTAKQPSGAPMEPLDLDSLLRSHGGDLFSSSDEDDDAASVHRRTVDELLIDSDSSDSDEAPRSTSISLPAEAIRAVSGEDERPAAAAAEILEERATSSFPWRSRSRELFSSSDSLSSLGFRRYSTPAVSSSPSSRPLPALFGGVRPSPKPGAALAAAAAASRSIPTPHAAAIKSRRAGTGSLEKAFQPPEPPADSLVEDGVGSEGLGGDGSEISEVVPSSNGKSVVVEDVDQFAAVSRSNSSPSEAETGEIPEENDVSFSIKDTENSQLLQEREEQVDSFPVDSTPVITDENVHELEFEAELEHTPEVESEALESERDDFEEKSIDNREGEEIDMGNEIDKLVEERLCQLENSKKAEKKLRASMKPLERAEELEKRLASSGLDWEEGAAAQPMRLEGIRRGPPAVGYLQIDLDNAVTRTVSSQTFLRDYGSLQVLAVHMSFIAVGTSRGAVIVFPSKYSAHCADSMDAKMLTFGAHGERSQTPVTSMCFNQQGDLLLVGYGDGHLTVWDVQRAAALKVVYGEHTAPVVHTLFLGQDSQVTRQFKAVTGDSKGLVVLHTFSVLLVPLLNRVSIKTQCLLDGQNTGTVLSASPLLMDGSVGYASQGNSTVGTSGLGSMVGGVVGGVVGGETGWKSFNEGSSLVEEGVVVFATHQNALVVRLSPNVEAYDKFSKPDGVREGSMPYTAWKCSGYSHSSSLDASDKASWLACAWDRKVQIAKLVKSEMKKYREWNLDSTVIGVAWLDDQMLVVLTLRGQLCLFSKDGTELHRTSFVVDGLGLDDIITYHTHFTNTFGNPEKAYHNSVAVRGATIYILGPVHLIVSRLLPWKERIQVLQRAGDWMGALDMAMRLYDGHAHGVIDLPRTVDAIRETIMPFLVELLLSYVDEVFSYISIAFCNQTGKVGQLECANSRDSSVHSEIEEQYARVGGVAVEFCVHIKRTDILFDSIFSKFVAVKHGGTFLEILEPYILKDMLGCLPPEIMQALVEHYSGKGWLQRVEQCVLHMDISSLDFNQVVKLCREHGLYGALIYLFNQGLADFKTPLEELLVVVQNSASIDTAIGYRMLVYLKYCFQGLAFPPGHGSLSHSQMPLVRKELLQFLLEDSKPFSSQVFKIFESSCRNFPNLCYLLWLDTEATLEVLRHAFPEEKHENSGFCHDLTAANMEQGKEYGFDSVENQNVLVQRVANVLVSVLDLESDAIRSFKIDDGEEVWPSRKDLGHLLEYIAYLVTCEGAIISWRVFKHILEYLTSQNLSPPHQENEVSQKEKQVITLLKALSQIEWDSSYVLHLCTEAQFFQACGLIHNIQDEYIAALDCYMKDLYEPVHAFAFINSMLLQLTNSQLSSFQSAVISRIPELVKLNRECTYFLVIDRFSDESQNILSNLHSHPQSLFLFLKTAIDVHLSGTLDFSVLVHASNIPYGRMSDSRSELEAYLARLKDFPKLLHHNVIQVTDEMAELYLELLCQYERTSVLKFLETFENYRLEHCLRLCQEYGVTDATAFLLERVGDVGSALELVMNGLDEKIDLLVAAIESKFSEITLSSLAEMDILPGVFKMSEVVSVHDILHASIGLCQRNTQRLDTEESKTLWFRLLDSFSEPLRRFYGGKEVPERRNLVDKLFGTSDTKLDGWRYSKLHKCASVLRRLFSQFVGEIIEGMAGYLALPEIMSKLLSDNGNQEFGDFKLSILRMLGTYGYEKRILDTAKTLIEDDTFYTMGLLKKGASHAFAPQDFMCCICGSPLTKGSNSLRIRVFNCGHCTHLHCESEESEPSSRYSAVGCPICLPKKNPRAKNKSILVDNGLVRNSISNAQHIQGFQHLHELDVDKPYGLHQMSRFDILNSLQKAQRSLEIDSLPQLRLSPPAIYHEKVQKGAGSLAGETSNTVVKNEKTTKRWHLRDLKSKGTISRFPLKSNIFGTEKNRVR